MDMKAIIETAMSVHTDERIKLAFREGAEFAVNTILKKMRELSDDEWLSDSEILDRLYEFVKK